MKFDYLLAFRTPLNRLRAFLLAAVITQLCVSRDADAQKVPGLGYAYPPAVSAGSAVDLQLGGFDFTTDMQWFVHDPRLPMEVLGEPGVYHIPPPPYWFGPRASAPALPIPREVSGRLTIPADFPAGLVRWQVANANGVSATAVFYVSRDREIIESRSRDNPQQISELPLAICGRLSRLTEVDRYEWVSQYDGWVSADLMARRLGSDFLGVLEAFDDQDRMIVDVADTMGRDAGLSFPVAKGRRYEIRIRDVDFRGDRAYVYRLSLVPGPRVRAIFPAFGVRGATREFEFVGNGIASGAHVPETIRRSVAIPSDPQLRAFEYVLESPAGKMTVSIPIVDGMSSVCDDSDAAGSAGGLELSGPQFTTGRWSKDREERRVHWLSEKDQYWSLSLLSHAIGGRLDLSFRVLGPDGATIGENDDHGGFTDSHFEFRAPAAGRYQCVFRSQGPPTGDADEVYCLQLRRVAPDFSISAPQQIQMPLVLEGEAVGTGKVEVTLTVHRTGGFDGEVAIAPSGLPPGVTVTGDWTVPAGKNECKGILQAAAGTAVVASMIQFHGTAKIGDQTIVRTSLAQAAGVLNARTSDEQRVAHSILALTLPAPFEIKVVDRERQHDVHRGTTFLADLKIVRSAGFAGPLELQMSAQQDRYRQGTLSGIVTVPADAVEAIYPCFLPEWLGTDLTRRIVIHGVATVPDATGRPRQLTKAADARITMIMEGALLKLATHAEDPQVRLGDRYQLPVSIVRSAKLPLETRIELTVPEEIRGLLTAEPLVLPAGSDRGVLQIESLHDARLLGPWQLRVTATALQDGKWPVVSETLVPLEFSP